MNDAVPLRTILVGTDNSTAAQRALTWAAARSRESDAQLVAVHVLTCTHEFATDLSPATMTTWRRELERDLAGPWTDAAREIGATVRTLVVEDETTRRDPQHGTARASDVVVLGAHGRGNLADRLLGAATTYTVTHRANTPLVIIPPDWQPAAA